MTLVLTGRRFDSTYYTLKRQRGALEQESESLLHRAVAFHARGQHTEAYNTFEHLITIDPCNVSVLYSYAYFLAFGVKNHNGSPSPNSTPHPPPSSRTLFLPSIPATARGYSPMKNTAAAAAAAQ